MKPKILILLLFAFSMIFLYKPTVAQVNKQFIHSVLEHEYYEYTPPVGKIVTQTDSSYYFELFGEIAKDFDMDGISDGRQKKLLELASLFSPILVKNEDDTPEPIKIEKINQILIVDKWDETQDPPRLVSTTHLGFDEYTDETDLFLKNWINRMLAKKLNTQSPHDSCLEHFYFDPPGENETSWSKEWAGFFKDENQVKQYRGIYMHPFVYKVPNLDDCYEIVFQYWFYYPYNDAANNHEGDWEHINVSLMLEAWDDSPSGNILEDLQEQIKKNPNSGDVFFTEAGIWYFINKLDNDSKFGSKLTIKRVDYYFHHSITSLYYWKNKWFYSNIPYRRGGEYNPIYFDECIKHRDLRQFIYFDEGKLKSADLIAKVKNNLGKSFDKGGVITKDSSFLASLRQKDKLPLEAEIVVEKKGRKWILLDKNSQKKYVIEKKYKLAFLKFIPSHLEIHDLGSGVHPLVFIGGTNTGYDQLKAPYCGIRDSASGGSYPFRGIWRDFSGFFARERINGSGKSISYQKNQIQILPDWERLFQARYFLGAIHHKDVRKKWSWLILPIRWGYPSSPSPLRDITKGQKFDVGDNAPVGPAYNNAWNRIRDAKGYEEYSPLFHPKGERRRLPTNYYDNNLGILNIFSSIVRIIPLIDVSFGPLYFKRIPVVDWFLGDLPPPYVISDAKNTKKLERYKLMGNQEIYAQDMSIGYSRVRADDDLARLILASANRDIVSQYIKEIRALKPDWGWSFNFLCSYLLENPTMRCLNSFQFQRFSPKLSFISKIDGEEKEVPLNISVFSAHIAAEPLLMKRGFIRFFPHLGAGYNRFTLKESEGLGFSIQGLPKKRFHNISINTGGGLAFHKGLFEVRLRYIIYFNMLKLGLQNLNGPHEDVRDTTFRQQLEFDITMGW